MSHTTTVKNLSIQSETAIRTAVQELNNQGIKVELKENIKPRAYYNNQIDECNFVLGLTGKYDIGLKFNKDTEEYDLLYDDYMREVSNILGAGKGQGNQTGKFNREYSKALITEKMHEQGHYDILFEEQENDELLVTVNI